MTVIDRFTDYWALITRKHQVLMDRWTIFPKERWVAIFVSLLVFLLRVYQTQGYAVVTYLLGLFYLNQIMLYLTPLVDPEEQDFEDRENILPVRDNDEFKGFQRKIQEFVLWKKLIHANLLCTFLTLFGFFDFPIFWPLLVFYFVFMTTFLCRYKIEHMIRYRYIPFDFGKKSYAS